jgi:hypothetical protein
METVGRTVMVRIYSVNVADRLVFFVGRSCHYEVMEVRLK